MSKYKETENVLKEVFSERKRQNRKWGEQNHAPAEYLMILGEEVGEANKAALEAHFHPGDDEEKESHYKNYREELVQIAAVAVAMVECFDRSQKKKIRGTACHYKGCPTNGHGPQPCALCYE